jgi:tetratricopeptide (TPR) repeat protein
MAPELWSTWPTTSPSMDVYAFGVLLYEIFCGQPPFVRNQLRKLRRAHAEAVPPSSREWNPELPPGLEDVMQRCLAKHPLDRPANFRELAAELSAVYREATGQDYKAVRQKPATPELDLELVKRDAWSKATAGVGAHRHGDLEKACRLMTEARETFRSLNDRAALQWVLYRHALVLRDRGELDEAWAMLEEQRALCEQGGDRGELSTCLCAQGMVLKAQGKLAESWRALQRNEAICRELDDQASLAGCLFNQATVLAEQDRAEAAMEKLTETERLSRELGDQASLQESLTYHARLLQACDRLEEALELFKQAEKICRELEDEEALAACLANQEATRRELGR